MVVLRQFWDNGLHSIGKLIQWWSWDLNPANPILESELLVTSPVGRTIQGVCVKKLLGAYEDNIRPFISMYLKKTEIRIVS